MKFFKQLPIIIFSILCFNCEHKTIHKPTDFFENGNIKIMSVFNGENIIQKIEFSKQGNVLSRNFYEYGKLISEWVSGDFFNENELISNHHSNGVLKSQGYMVDGNLHGNWSYYNRYGDLESNRYYLFGKPIGDWYSYNHDMISNVVHYGYVKGNGHLTDYYDNGNIKESTFFNNGMLSGKYEYYYNNGKLKVQGYYVDGKKDSKWIYYNKFGKVTKIENYNIGMLEGDFLLYFDDGTTEKLIGKYHRGKRVKDWFWYFDIDKKSNYKKHYSK